MTGDDLRQERKSRRLTITQLARLAGRGRSSIQGYETGKNPIPRSVAQTITAVLADIPVDVPVRIADNVDPETAAWAQRLRRRHNNRNRTRRNSSGA